MSRIREIDSLSISRAGKAHLLVQEYPDLNDVLFIMFYTQSKRSLNELIIYTNYSQEYYATFTIDELIDMAKEYNSFQCFEAIYTKCDNKIEIYDILRDNCTDHCVLSKMFISLSLRDENMDLFQQIVSKGGHYMLGERKINLCAGYFINESIRDIIRYNRKEFLTYLVKHSVSIGVDIKGMIGDNIMSDVNSCSTILKSIIDNTDYTIEQIIEEVPIVSTSVLQSLYLAGADVELLRNKPYFDEWHQSLDI
jgi:hypothetical protein